MLAALPADAAELGSDAVRKLVSGTVWSTERMLNSNQLRSLDWKKDGTLCLRLGGTSGKCDDSGTWRIVGQRVCYELTWWMKSYDMASACLGVSDLGNGRYEAKLVNGTSFMQFTVAP
jgi:hypothetical protein